MKIWVIGRGYPTPANRMWGSFELEQAKMLQRHGHNVSYISLTLSFFSRKDPRGFRCFNDSGVDVYAYSHLYFPGKAGIYLEKFEDKCWAKLFSAAKEKGGLPDVIHIHYPAMISSINEVEKLRKNNVKIFVTEHWTRVQINNLKKHETRRLKYYASHANCFFTVGKSLYDSVNKLAEVSVPMDIVPNMFSPLFKLNKNRNDTGEFIFVASGRMVPHKRFDVIISQFIKTFGNDPSIKLKLIGNGSEREKLEKLCNNSRQIIFTGTLKSDAVAKEVSNANALVCYSALETFAVPVIEAWACGLPIITAASVPVSIYCDDTRGIIVSDNDYDELGKAMKKIYDSYYKYDPEIISAYAVNNFGDEAIYSKLISSYEKY